ncbi:uncharacterized protein RSE6_10674 [Rhynchosporium secalis]|uniref:2EXR domain-containing protein n=1 Tax=Rhynchosporium secalis TaxID=38038 RepID=A0A1E1ML17_RHYSE|nr:uncharacterized protein RSE6_10674 [Rhynchosporium secalis]
MAATTYPNSRFHPFPTLPPELRLKIWQLARPGPRVLHLLHNPRINHLVSINLAPAILHTSQEARVETLKTLKPFFDPRWPATVAATRQFPCVYINPAIDTFYFPVINNRALPTPLLTVTPPPFSLPFVPDVLPHVPRTGHILRVQACDLDNMQLSTSALFAVRHIAFSEVMWRTFFASAVNTHVFLLEFRELETVTVVVDCTFSLTRKQLSFEELLGERGDGTFDVESKEDRERGLRRVLLDGMVQRTLGVEEPLERKRILEGYRGGMMAKLNDLKTRDTTWKVPRVEVKVVMRGDWV